MTNFRYMAVVTFSSLEQDIWKGLPLPSVGKLRMRLPLSQTNATSVGSTLGHQQEAVRLSRRHIGKLRAQTNAYLEEVLDTSNSGNNIVALPSSANDFLTDKANQAEVTRLAKLRNVNEITKTARKYSDTPHNQTMRGNQMMRD